MEELLTENNTEIHQLKPEPKKKKHSKIEKRNAIFAYCMVAVGFIHFCIFYIYLNFNSILLAFQVQRADGSQVFSWYNFQRLFNELSQPDTQVFRAFVNTIKYFVLGVVKMFITFLVSYFIYKKIPLYKAYRIIFFLPSIIPSIVMVTVFKNFVSPYGPLWTVLYDVFGYDMPSLLTQPETATPTIMFYVFWAGFGVQMLIFVGALNRIPEEVIDSAKLDGCSWWKEFTRIVLPLAWETLLIYLTLSIGGIFMATGPILYFTGGNEYTNTMTLEFWIYIQVQSRGTYNYPAAIGLFFTVLAIPIVALSRWLLRKLNNNVTY